MTRVKICGLQTIEHALGAVEAGANALGFVFAPSSRRVTPETARTIIQNLPPFVSTVGVFVDEDPKVVDHIARFCSLDMLQLHGSESPDYCRRFGARRVIKALRISDRNSLDKAEGYRGFSLLLDTYVPGAQGGTGKTFDWSLAREAKVFGPVILAGGLNPGNVTQAVREADPFAVDVSSGVETDGVKDPVKMRKFIDELRRCRYVSQ